MSGPPLETIRGELVSQRIVGADMWGIAELRVGADGRTVTATGNLLGTSPGDTLELDGVWTTHPKWGEQFKVRALRVVVPQDNSGAVKWLAKLPQIGRQRATALVERFGVPGIWEVVEKTPELLEQVPGITAVRRDEITCRYHEVRHARDREARLLGWGLTQGQITRVLAKWGEQAEEVLREDPYQLCDEVYGFGFTRADAVARRMGLSQDAPPRLRAGVMHVLREMAADGGHCYLRRPKLLGAAARLLSVDIGLVARQLDHVLVEGRAYEDDEGRVYLSHLHHAEGEVAAAVADLLERAAEEEEGGDRVHPREGSPRTNTVDAGSNAGHQGVTAGRDRHSDEESAA